MPNRFPFTKTALEAIPLGGPGERARYYDTRAAGLVLRVSSAGKVFYFMKRAGGRGAPQLQQKIGPFPVVSVDQARTKAAELAGKVALKEPRRARDLTFGELGDWWLEHARAHKRTWTYDERQLAAWFTPWRSRRLSTITVHEVEALHARIGVPRRLPDGSRQGGPGAANRAMALGSAMFNRAIRKGRHLGPNPFLAVEPFRIASRSRRLGAGEVAGFLAALEAEPNVQLRDFVTLLLFTGARRGAVLAMAWADVDIVGQLWTIPPEAAKNDRVQVVPLGPDEVAILARRRQVAAGPWVFPGRVHSASGHYHNPKHGWAGILKRWQASAGLAEVPDLRMHDLRRTLGSWMADTGSSLHLVAETLGHTSTWVTHVYARLATSSVREGKAKAIEALKAAGAPAVPAASRRRRRVGPAVRARRHG